MAQRFEQTPHSVHSRQAPHCDDDEALPIANTDKPKHDRSNTFPNRTPRIKMVVYYQIAGQKVGSHIVRTTTRNIPDYSRTATALPLTLSFWVLHIRLLNLADHVVL